MGKEAELEIEEELELADGAETDDDFDTDTEARGDSLPDEPTDDDLKAVAGDDDEEGDGDEPKGSKVVPHARFNEVNEALKTEREARIRADERARVLEEQLKGGAGGDKGGNKNDPPEIDLRALRKQRNDALVEGDTEKAAELDEQIDAEVERRAAERAAAAAENSILTRQARQEFSSAVSESIEKYPFLDAKGEAPNAQAINEVVEWRDFYISKGKSPAEALRNAVAKVAPIHAPKKKPGKAVVDDDEGDDDDQEASRAELRRKLALKRNAAAANAQPARPGGVGERSSAAKLKVEDLSEEEYDKLPEKAKRALRGDEV